jgi:hypothetical protein
MTTTGTTTSGMKQRVVPLISSDTAGPLGAIHLPRLWSKLTLSNAGLLHEEYDECGPGFDQMTITDLNLDRDKVIDYVKKNKPKYLQFESWVVEQNGGKIDPQTIKKHNDAILGYLHSDELSAEMRKKCGMQDENVKDAVTLNKLEDLDELYNTVNAK